MDEKKIVETMAEGAEVVLKDDGIDIMAKIVKKAKKSGTAIGFGVGLLSAGYRDCNRCLFARGGIGPYGHNV